MRLKLFHKLLLVNIGIIFALTIAFLSLSYASNKTLLSTAMNGVDEKVMESLSVLLGQHYSQSGSWDRYANDSQHWKDIVDSTFFRVFLSLSAQPSPGHYDNHAKSPVDVAGAKPALQEPCDPPFGTFLQRLSLLSADRETLIPPEMFVEDANFQAIRHDKEVVGWLRVGKIDMDVLPLAEHFFDEQIQLISWAATLGGIVAATLSFFLSRQLTAPIDRLAFGANQIAQRNFQHKIEVETHDELQRLAQSFNTVAIELSRYETLQKQWLMDISHELRTPLTILVGEISAISDNLTKCDSQAIASLKDEVMQIVRLVDDLHELSAMDQVEFSFNKREIDLTGVVDGQIQRYQNKLRENSIQLHAVLPGRPVMVLADSDRIAQVLRNLLENCLRYSSRPSEVWVGLGIERAMAELVIEDSGPGVPQEYLPKLFDRLYRGENSRNRKTGGSGLGLTICRKIILAHGGEMSASHSRKGGLCVRVLIPLLKG